MELPPPHWMFFISHESIWSCRILRPKSSDFYTVSSLRIGSAASHHYTPILHFLLAISHSLTFSIPTCFSLFSGFQKFKTNKKRKTYYLIFSPFIWKPRKTSWLQKHQELNLKSGIVTKLISFIREKWNKNENSITQLRYLLCEWSFDYIGDLAAESSSLSGLPLPPCVRP